MQEMNSGEERQGTRQNALEAVAKSNERRERPLRGAGGRKGGWLHMALGSKHKTIKCIRTGSWSFKDPTCHMGCPGGDGCPVGSLPHRVGSALKGP